MTKYFFMLLASSGIFMSCSKEEIKSFPFAYPRSGFNVEVSLLKSDNTSELVSATTVSASRINNGLILVRLDAGTESEAAYYVNEVNVLQQNDLMKVTTFTGNNVSIFSQKSTCKIQKLNNDQLAISINNGVASVANSAIIDEDDGF